MPEDQRLSSGQTVLPDEQISPDRLLPTSLDLGELRREPFGENSIQPVMSMFARRTPCRAR